MKPAHSPPPDPSWPLGEPCNRHSHAPQPTPVEGRPNWWEGPHGREPFYVEPVTPKATP